MPHLLTYPFHVGQGSGILDATTQTLLARREERQGAAALAHAFCF